MSSKVCHVPQTPQRKNLLSQLLDELSAIDGSRAAAKSLALVMNYWLVKSEPGTYSWETFVKEKRTAWTGVRNFQARNNLRAMKRGDLVFFYHSGEGKDIVGLARVDKEAYPDPTAKEGDWSCVDLVPVKALAQPVTLAQIKSDKAFSDMQLVKLSRISVTSVREAEFKYLLKLGDTKL